MADDEARWYVVHTYSGYENKVANDLVKTVEELGTELLPQQLFHFSRADSVMLPFSSMPSRI